MDNKTLIDSIADKLECSQQEVADLLADFSTLMGNILLDSDVVAIPSFGNFETKKRLERISVHPSSGKRLLVPPKLVVGFKPSAVLKAKLSDGVSD
ncbi:MAG: HU family DNA-binding protein [Clostridium sp.]|nr:HU family DNA-binding protein [Prevotella sp.]MCM1428213.1 HU family DNA-binding protein [Clostridium sp.]MCM1475943.1 HU family DNA-binding protein [Muribaculaceae bacterium]